MSAAPPETVSLESEWEVYEATAYTAGCRGCSGITKTGIDVRQTIVDEEGRRIIAVDPEVIPLGTALNVRIGNETFDAVAADIGGAIKGRKIDVLMASYDEAIKFGRQDVEVRVLDEGATFEK
ncbi:3D domain-containing protein [Paenibacillus sp. CAU 1782]